MTLTLLCQTDYTPNKPDQAAVDFPASSPSALGWGGTTLRVSGTKITDEVVWEDHSGGGVSRIFNLPSYYPGKKVSHPCTY